MKSIRAWLPVFAALFFVVSLLVMPLAFVGAVQSKTYSFTPTHAKNYVTTGIVDFTETSATVDWYSDEWAYRQKISVDHEKVGGNLSQFPLLIKMSGQIFDSAQSDGHDIVFTAHDGRTKLSHEIENFNGELVAWVRVPELSVTEDTIVYVYYGKLNANDQQNVTDVWSGNYAGVWHMNTDAATNQPDATTSDNNGVPGARVFSDEATAVGKMAGAVNFDGIDDGITTESTNNLDITSNLSVSVWIKADSLRSSKVSPLLSQSSAGN